MLRSSLSLAAAVVVFGACGADTATQETVPPPAHAPGAATPRTDSAGSSEDGRAAVVVPENAEDRAIRRELNSALAQDPRLKDREISFLVSNGDVSVTGTVGSEDERRMFNDIAMGITGVKSVANALRVEE
jgi:BON domain